MKTLSEQQSTLGERTRRGALGAALRSQRERAWARLAAIGPSRWLMIAVLALDALLVLSAFVGSHYFGIDVASTIAYPPVDGHCMVQSEGIGNHCFSDYTIFSKLALSLNPWANDQGIFVNYLAGGLLPHLIFGSLAHLVGSARIGLVAYMIVLTAAVVTPAIWATWRRSMENKILTVSLFGILSVAGLAVIDRGNTVAFAIPAMLLFVVGLARDRPMMVAVSIVWATLVKPQYVLLVVAVLTLRKWKTAFVALAGVVVSNSLAYLLWPASFPATLLQSLKNAATFGGTYFGSITEERAQTVSFARGVFGVEKGLAQLLGIQDQSWFVSVAAMGGLVIAIALLVLLFFAGRAMPAALLGCLVLAISSMVLTTSYSYYSVFALPIAAVVFRNPITAGDQSGREFSGVLDRVSRSRGQSLAIALIVVSLALTVSRVILPVVSTLYDDQLQTSTTLVPIVWAIAVVVTALAFSSNGQRNLVPRNGVQPDDTVTQLGTGVAKD